LTRTVIATPKAPKAPPYYSQAVKAGGLVFVSGTLPLDLATGSPVGTTIQAQTAQCLRNISAILEAAGTSLKNAVQATVIMVHEEDFAGLNEEWVKWFPDSPPARHAAKMPINLPGMRVSIAMIAAMPA
jgi:2-iminobutanoate/2-iminopropanoate deaminase